MRERALRICFDTAYRAREFTAEKGRTALRQQTDETGSVRVRDHPAIFWICRFSSLLPSLTPVQRPSGLGQLVSGLTSGPAR